MARDRRSWSAEDAVQDVLLPEEKVQWSGRPASSRGLDRQDVQFIFFSGYFAVTDWGIIFFGLISPAAFFTRVLLPLLQILYFVVVRPAIRRSQRRNTVFALTNSRALVIQGPPRPRLDAAYLEEPYQAWRRSDGRGTVSFDSAPTPVEKAPLKGLRTAYRAILFVLGLGSSPFPGQKKRVPQLTFYEVENVEQLLRLLEERGVTEKPSDSVIPAVMSERWGGLLERGFTPSRRTACAVLGVVLVLATVPVIAVRGRDYLQHSPTLIRPGSIELELAPATYVVFEHTAAMGTYDCYSVAQCATIGPSNVSVVSRSGTRLVVTGDPGVGAITDGKIHPLGVVAFYVPRVDRYRVTIRSSTAAEFIIAKKPSEELAALAGWIVVGAIGVIFILIALIGALVARGRRRSIMSQR